MKLFGQEIEKDKWLHFLVGILIGFCASSFSSVLIEDLRILTMIGIGTSLLIGTLKELYDKAYESHAEILDAVFTFVGGCIGTFLTIILLKI